MYCECINWDIREQIKAKNAFMLGNHHPDCPKYSTEKFPRLFFKHVETGKLIPAPEKVAHVIDVKTMTDEAPVAIEFHCVMMTDEEFEKKHSRLLNPLYEPQVGDWFDPQGWTWKNIRPWVNFVEQCPTPFNEDDFNKAKHFGHIIVLDPTNSVRRLDSKEFKYIKRELKYSDVFK